MVKSKLKVRKERNGLHLFDRKSGLHILVDEVKFEDDFHIAPRTVSIALTNKCNLGCYYCYAPKNNMTLPKEFVKNLAQKLDKLGVLEITFGGGEPFLHPDIIEICKWIWENTNLGITITTNGTLLNKVVVEDIKDYISFLRISIDGSSSTYRKIKRTELEQVLANISHINDFIPFGLNVIARPGYVKEVENVADLALEIGAKNILIIPEHKNGNFILNKEDWEELKNIIMEYISRIEIYVTYDVTNFISIPTLDLNDNGEFLFVHVSADKKLKLNSFQEDGIPINDDTSNLEEVILKLRELYFKEVGGRI